MKTDDTSWKDLKKEGRFLSFLLAAHFLKDEKKSLLSFMKSIPIFSGFNGLELHQISRLFYRRHFADGEAIIRQGEQGLGIYFVSLGEVKIDFQDSTLHQGLETFLKRGEFFGEDALFEKGPLRDFSAWALGETEVLGLFRPDMESLIEEKPRLAAKLYKCFGQVINQKLSQVYLHLKEKER